MSEVAPALRTSANNLESLVSFYQQERMWVYKTKAEFQDLDEEEDEDSPPRSSPSPSHESESSIRPSRRSTSPSSRWIRRKKGLKLNLASAPASRKTLQTSVDAAHNPALRVLDMYESIMQSRMESCQRINRLIRNANKAHPSRVTGTQYVQPLFPATSFRDAHTEIRLHSRHQRRASGQSVGSGSEDYP